MHLLNGQAAVVTGAGSKSHWAWDPKAFLQPWPCPEHHESIDCSPESTTEMWYKYGINEIGPSHVQYSQQKQASHWKQSWIRLRLHRSKCELLGCNPAEIPRYFERSAHSKHIQSTFSSSTSTQFAQRWESALAEDRSCDSMSDMTTSTPWNMTTRHHDLCRNRDYPWLPSKLSTNLTLAGTCYWESSTRLGTSDCNDCSMCLSWADDEHVQSDMERSWMNSESAGSKPWKLQLRQPLLDGKLQEWPSQMPFHELGADYWQTCVLSCKRVT